MVLAPAVHTRNTNITTMKNTVSFAVPVHTAHAPTAPTRSTSTAVALTNAFIVAQLQMGHVRIVLTVSTKNSLLFL